MKIAIDVVRIDISKGNVLDFEIRPPGKVRLGFVQVDHEPVIASPLLLQNGQIGAKNEPRLWPAIVVEFDPDRAPVRRRFVAMGMGMVIDSMVQLGCKELRFVAAIAGADGRPFVLYEAPITTALPALTERAEPPSPTLPPSLAEQLLRRAGH